MKKFKKLLLMIILLVFAVTPILSSCTFNIFSDRKLSTPEITLHSDSKCITWSDIKRASSYDIYCNSTLSDTLTNDMQSTSLIYDFSTLLSSNGEYSFYIIAKSTNSLYEDSSASNIVKFNYVAETIETPATPSEDIEEDSQITLSLNNTTLSYTTLDEDVDKYTLYLYSNSTGLNSYDLSSTSANLNTSTYSLKDEIYAIRVGYTVDGVSVISSDIIYLNPDNYAPYTDNIYIFDGYINDFYIESLQELNNIVYYQFINRNGSYNIRLSSSFYNNELVSGFDGSTNVEILTNAVAYSYDRFYETMSYTLNSCKQISSSTLEFTVSVDYYGYVECNTSISAKASQTYTQNVSDPYYEIMTYQTRAEVYGEDYDNFASDKRFLYTEVTTSEQLYWAVENKITPIFTSTSSRAYTIYNKVKQILNQIISDDMTDYEKALSIFDYICVNTNYDYTDYSSGYAINYSNYPMALPCFYLEGVFTTGYSVCDGFSKAFSLMCNMLDIDAIRIVGDAVVGTSSGGHAWNKVLVDKDITDSTPAQYYLVDITWTEIVTSDGEEEISHMYFMLGDEDVESTHIQYRYREKFNNYSSASNLYYYDYQTFEYNGTNNNLVISSEEELEDMFSYMMIESRESMEIVMDLDFMIDCYEAVYGEGSYLSSSQVEEQTSGSYVISRYYYATDTLEYYTYYMNGAYTTTSYYYYKLKNTFAETMRSAKFAEQFLFLNSTDNVIVFNESGDTGLLYILEQNLLIDESSEVAHLVNYISENKINGEYTLYIDSDILSTASGINDLTRAKNLFKTVANNAGVTISFTLVESSVTYGSGSSDTGSIFKIVVSCS